MERMHCDGFEGRYEFDPEAGLFHGEVLFSHGIKDVVTFQGQTLEELRQAMADSVADYLEFKAIATAHTVPQTQDPS